MNDTDAPAPNVLEALKLRAAAGALLGYLVISVLVAAGFAVAWALLGADRAFQPGSWDTSTIWNLTAVVLGLTSAVAGGWVCTKVAKYAAGPWM